MHAHFILKNTKSKYRYNLSRGVHSTARGPHVAQDGYECSPTQNHKLLKALGVFLVIMCHDVFNVWPNTTLLLPVWPRDTKRLDTPEF